METYIVRIYRRDRSTVIGVIEWIEGDSKRSRHFNNLDELKKLLESPVIELLAGGRNGHANLRAHPWHFDFFDSEGVCHLHRHLREMCARTVAEPSRLARAPGYYAIYFTDDQDGVKLEYVHHEN